MKFKFEKEIVSLKEKLRNLRFELHTGTEKAN